VRVVWLAQAEAELDAAIDYYYFQAGAAVAHDFRIETERVATLLGEHRQLGAQIQHNARRLPLHGYPFDLVYRASADSIIVIALAHQRRRPGYWMGRRES
jgi:plasmid stabilization system protein ParE